LSVLLPRELAPFTIVEPQGEPTPLVVEVPHAGTAIDAQSMAYTIAPIRAIGRDADLFVDRLFVDAPSLGAASVVANVSRFVVDLNRGPDDYDGLAVEGGAANNLPRGLIWRTTTEGDPVLAQRLSRAELGRRLARYYEPYHAEVRRLLDERRRRFGFAILLCAHSMPSQGRRGHTDVGVGRADIVPGTRGRTSARPEVIDLVDAEVRAAAFSVKHDDPYRGGFSTLHYGRPSENVHAIQIEIARKLYMDEDALSISEPGFSRVRDLARTLVERLGALRL
jgi:N-formylglutamate amidohydrolase